MPLYNSSRYDQKPEYSKHIRTIMANSTFVSVSTDELGQFYQEHFKLDKQKFRTVPNFIPHWWAGPRPDGPRKLNKRLRIGFPCGFSHYDIKDMNNGIDDFSHITDMIRETCSEFEWVFFGQYPKCLFDLVIDKKITVINGSSFIHYLQFLRKLNIDMFVAPLIDNKFNQCKSNIKLLEGYAIGVPVIAQDMTTYNKYSNTVFKDSNTLYDHIVTLSNQKKYNEAIKSNYEFIDHDETHENHRWWIENNMHYHTQFI
jgi:hypothetical protein